MHAIYYNASAPMLLDIRPDYLQLVKEILQKHVPQYEVWAFGSRAKWTAKEYSDLDLCVVSDQPLSFKVLGAMAEDFSESDLPWKVDIVDWATTSASFRKIIQWDKVVVQSVGRVRAATRHLGKENGGLPCGESTLRVSPSGRNPTTPANISENIGERDVGLCCANMTYGIGWQLTTLGRICEAQGGAIQTGPFGSQLHTSDYQEFGIPVVMPTNIGDGGIIENGIARIGHADVARLSQHKLCLGDIVFSRRGDVTKNALIRPHEVGWLCGTGCLKVRLNDESIANAKFISHCLRLPQIKEWLVRHAVGATMPNLNTGILSDVPIHLPPLKVQLDIAETLGALDDRIALLRETNATLEGIAQTLFKSWFVDFDPVHAKQQGIAPAGMDEPTAALFPDGFEESELGLVPRGWKVGTLANLATLNPEAWTAKNHPVTVAYIDLANVKNNEIAAVADYLFDEAPSRARRVLRNGDTIVGTVRPGNRSFAFIFDPANNLTASTGFAVLRPKMIQNTEFIYLAATQDSSIEHLAHVADGGAYPAVRPDVVLGISCVLPSDAIMQAFHHALAPILGSIAEKQQQAQTLATLRDTLLPRLISGQLRLSAAALDEVKA
jgi:type I restriction enzyme S subunit